jgi:hypothetical protein
MSTPIKTLIQWIYRFLLVAVLIGLSGWGLVLIPAAGFLLDPIPDNSLLWQQLMGVCVWQIGTVELCAAVVAMIIFCPLVEVIVWQHNRRCVPGAYITVDALLCFPTRRSWKKGAARLS